jgi:hypothetical protein
MYTLNLRIICMYTYYVGSMYYNIEFADHTSTYYKTNSLNEIFIIKIKPDRNL